MVLYLNEGFLYEAVSPDAVVDAIDNRRGILMSYDDGESGHTGRRYIEPYAYGATKSGNPCIRAYQYYGDTKRGTPKWKLFRLDRILDWEDSGNTFDVEPKARGWAAEEYNSNGDGSMSAVYRLVRLDDGESLSDYEKLKRRTAQLKTGKRINVSDLEKERPEVEKGPVGSNKPQFTSSGKPETAGDDNKDLQQQNGAKANDEKPPVMKEPSVQGPITGDATNPEENTADELMSNDKFREMLKRNLQISDKDRNRRFGTNAEA